MVPFSFSFERHNANHCILNSRICSGVPPLSQSPLSTHTALPLWTLMPPLLKKYGGSAKMALKDLSGKFPISFIQSPWMIQNSFFESVLHSHSVFKDEISYKHYIFGFKVECYGVIWMPFCFYYFKFKVFYFLIFFRSIVIYFYIFKLC